MSTGKAVLALAAFFAFCHSPGASAQADCTEDTCARIGSFNIQLLGQGGPADTTEELEEVARLIAEEADLDLAVLEEINADSQQWEDLKSLLEKRGYNADIVSSSGGRNEQYIVIIYRPDRVTQLADATEMKIDTTLTEEGNPSCTYDNFRPPLQTSFRIGEFDFVLVGVHLKSQRPAGDNDEDCDDNLRKIQAGILLDRLAASQSGSQETDVLVVGDFNDDPRRQSLTPFRDAGFESAVREDALREGSATHSYIGYPRDELIDHVMLRPEATREWVPGSSNILAPEDREEYLDHVSDHLPVWTSFSIVKDDD